MNANRNSCCASDVLWTFPSVPPGLWFYLRFIACISQCSAMFFASLLWSKSHHNEVIFGPIGRKVGAFYPDVKLEPKLYYYGFQDRLPEKLSKLSRSWIQTCPYSFPTKAFILDCLGCFIILSPFSFPSSLSRLLPPSFSFLHRPSVTFYLLLFLLFSLSLFFSPLFTYTDLLSFFSPSQASFPFPSSSNLSLKTPPLSTFANRAFKSEAHGLVFIRLFMGASLFMTRSAVFLPRLSIFIVAFSGRSTNLTKSSPPIRKNCSVFIEVLVLFHQCAW